MELLIYYDSLMPLINFILFTTVAPHNNHFMH